MEIENILIVWFLIIIVTDCKRGVGLRGLFIAITNLIENRNVHEKEIVK